MSASGGFVPATAERVIADIAIWAPQAANWPPVLIFSLVVGLLLIKAAYNVFFHPLARFPGPFLGRATLLWQYNNTATGKIHIAIEKLHRQYGMPVISQRPIVRITPSELSFASVESWKAIYGHVTLGMPVAIKSPFYDVFGVWFRKSCIGSERNPKKHGEMRRMLSSAFSQRSLLKQEGTVARIVDRFIEIIGKKGGKGSQGLNMTKMVGFDVLGEMAFGESFHSLEDGKPHFRSDLVEDHLYLITLVDNLSRLPFRHARQDRVPIDLSRPEPKFPVQQDRSGKVSVVETENGYANSYQRRLSSKTGQRDFLTTLTEKVRTGEVGKEEMTAHVSTLAIAGGETVSTFLAGTTFFLLKNPDALKKLTAEIREVFGSLDEIGAQKAQQLSYLQAVINEGLRIYPPGSQGFPRISPGFELHGEFIPPDTEIHTSAWAVTHGSKYCKDPMQFKPERWTDPNSRDVKEASQPFSLGPRGCL
ncbi:cytochrome P450 [Aspergillus arachidicola]|uniref:Cytochrome P450 n=1 Tax=Aspergillus arachidicola TaxID=656916 RepID=A0A5N6YMY2_9EURO|nr:cytochrome P450 [Aspergillus arachidicola]